MIRTKQSEELPRQEIYAGIFGWGGAVKPNVLGSDFSRVERNFTIGQSPNIWSNF